MTEPSTITISAGPFPDSICIRQSAFSAEAHVSLSFASHWIARVVKESLPLSHRNARIVIEDIRFGGKAA